MRDLLEMLTYMRPAGSRAERTFIRRFIVPTGARPDARGNYILRIGAAPVAWCSHTDTVHRTGGRQLVRVGKDRWGADIVDAPQSDCLGADDTTGVWLMLEMIRAQRPGLYIFHRAEERGCQGSRWIERHTPELLDGIDYAIAFDRRGTDSIVTHQIGWRTASDDFAWSLAEQLPGNMAPDPTGVFTDTESYAGIVPECTNVSVGYWDQHTARECQDLAFARAMRDALLALDVDALDCARRPGHETYLVEDAEWWEDDDTEPDTCGMCGTARDLWYFLAGEPVCRECFNAVTA
jgi:hypothetical protein